MSECASSEPYALQELDNSMEPEFPDQCIVIIQPADRCGDGDYVFIEVEGVRWFRRYVENEENGKMLLADNDLYPEIDLNGLDFKVLGIIVQRNVRRKIKHYHPKLA